MAKRIKTYKHSNEWGEYTVHEYSNGIIVKSLTKPSKKYKDKIEKRQSEHKKKQAEKEKVQAREKLITEKMRELAIQELEKEGKL